MKIEEFCQLLYIIPFASDRHQLVGFSVKNYIMILNGYISWEEAPKMFFVFDRYQSVDFCIETEYNDTKR